MAKVEKRKNCDFQKSFFSFGRLTTRYRYTVPEWLEHPWGNYGDCIQAFAVENIYQEMGIPSSELTMINRDEIDAYTGEQVIVVMQGWFSGFSPLAWSRHITPVFFGYHLQTSAHELFIESGALQLMKDQQLVVGCRDRQTADFLGLHGINAYYSGCLTMTFPKRKEPLRKGKVFIVDVPDEFLKEIPQNIKKKATFLTHVHPFKSLPVSDAEYSEFENKARILLNRYRTEARLVITTRLHVAMPCIAFGIPVVFFSREEGDCRLDVLQGIVDVHRLGDMGKVNWNPPVPDIELVKDLIKSNIKSRIQEAMQNEGKVKK